MIRQTLCKQIERWLFQTRTKGSIRKKLLTVIKQRLIEMAKNCQVPIEAENYMIAF